MKLGAYQSQTILDPTPAKCLKGEVGWMTMTTKVSSTLGGRECHAERPKQKKVGRVVNSKILTSGRKEVLEKMNLRKKMRDSNTGWREEASTKDGRLKKKKKPILRVKAKVVEERRSKRMKNKLRR